MSPMIKRMRIFAGPNGSGKSTLYEYLVRIGAFRQYYFINADVIANDLNVSLDISNYPFVFSAEELCKFLDISPFQNLVPYQLSKQIDIQEKVISLKKTKDENTTYLAAAIAEFLRSKMMQTDSSFSFETVFSHPSKIKEIQTAKKAGFKTYLYCIATSDHTIGMQRIQNRVRCGGHNVPVEKVKSRYFKTMENMIDAFKLCDKVFFFDNSAEKSNAAYNCFAEKNGNTLRFDPSVPLWFETYILKNI
ncbi:MAG: zeta toxin family protein [Termitinemataceae bacterium]|nr:MAG: zeta toxin family protein [Termitinemataceae bacterium]